MPDLWTREETLAAFNLYCRTSFGKLHARNADIIHLARRLGRTPASVAMKCCNLASLDPAVRARNVKGLTKASKLDREVWEAFRADPEQVGYESETAWAAASDAEPRQAMTIEWKGIAGLDRRAMVKVRVNQHLFRAMILVSYDERCAICALPIAGLLVAAHIVPWSVDPALRMNPHNGICLCALHDRAFDLGILSIGGDLRVAACEAKMARHDDPAARRALWTFVGKKMRAPNRWPPDPELLERQRAWKAGGPQRTLAGAAGSFGGNSQIPHHK
jgi:putative restriction endonuclease